MIEYRTFRNSDPPHLTRLWLESDLGRGAASNFTSDALDLVVLSHLYFDRRGVILALDGEKIVGYVHAGFGVNEDESDLDSSRGVILVVMVLPAYRRQGIGRELIQRAEEYLRERGAKTITAGPANGTDSFYMGLYGGTQPCGFLESDRSAAPFFQALGYQPAERYAVFAKENSEPNDPLNFKIVNARRKMGLGIVDQEDDPTWWWVTRLGRLETVRMLLMPKVGGDPVAGVTLVDLDLYFLKWQHRVLGLTDLYVDERERRQGYAQTLLIDVCRRLRQELVTMVEASCPESNTAGMATLKSAGFDRVDTGIVYRKPD